MNVPYSRYVLAPCPYIPFEFYLQQIGQRQLPVQCMPHFTLENWVHPPQPFMMYPCNPVVDGNAVPSKSGPTAMLPSYFQENSNEMSFAGRMAAANTDEGIEFTQIAARATAEDAGKYPRQRKWTNKKKYQCPSCKLSFSRTNSLAAHKVSNLYVCLFLILCYHGNRFSY